MLQKVGWKKDFVLKSTPVLPISGWIGDNLLKKSTNMTWWNGMDIEVETKTGQQKLHIDTLHDEDKVAELWESWKGRKEGDVPATQVCKICLERPMDCVFLECGHMATCSQCAARCEECPICRAPISKRVHVFLT